MHGHGRCTRLSTCLVNAAFVVAFVACVNADNFFVMYLILIKSPMHRHGRGTGPNTCLVYAPCVVAFVACVNADKFSVYVPDFIEVGYARAWTRYMPRYMPSECRVCCGLCCMCECWWVFCLCTWFNWSQLCTSMDEARASRHAWCSSRVLCVVSLQHVSMFQCIGCARAWTRQAPS